ncbi:MAG: hypothetical protein V4463_10235 [Pseudomonadota bacterium]
MFNPLLEKNLPIVLRVSGALTALGGLQFFAPGPMLAQIGMPVSEVGGLFFARHWGLMVLCFGLLLAYSATVNALRTPVLLAATAEKLGLVVMVALAYDTPQLAGLRPAALFDAACVVLYLMILQRRLGQQ